MSNVQRMYHLIQARAGMLKKYPCKAKSCAAFVPGTRTYVRAQLWRRLIKTLNRQLVEIKGEWRQAVADNLLSEAAWLEFERRSVAKRLRYFTGKLARVEGRKAKARPEIIRLLRLDVERSRAR